MGKDATQMAAEMLEAAGAKEISLSHQLTVPGRIIHELGTARMGSDPKKSVVSKYNQVWDAKNVFVTDGAAYVGSANQNPTLTILALTIRACEYLTEEMKRGAL
jgi:choline dehydrogenase-like flavoprotein